MKSLTQIKNQLDASNIDALNNNNLGLVKGGTGCGYGYGKTKSRKAKSVKSLKVKCGSRKSTKKSSATPYCNPRPRPCSGW
jgi:hypothetical protein